MKKSILILSVFIYSLLLISLTACITLEVRENGKQEKILAEEYEPYPNFWNKWCTDHPNHESCKPGGSASITYGDYCKNRPNDPNCSFFNSQSNSEEVPDGEKVICCKTGNNYAWVREDECNNGTKQKDQDCYGNVGCGKNATMTSGGICICANGFFMNNEHECEPCPKGTVSNTTRTGCETDNSGVVQTNPGGSPTGGTPSTPTTPSSTGKCYTDSNGKYVVGSYDGQTGYTLVSSTTNNCNNINVKKVDGKGTTLQGATISFTDSSNSSNSKTYNIGQTDISKLSPGSYVIKETVAPQSYTLDKTEIKITVNTDGTIRVSAGTNVDLNNSNGTRNITLSIKNSQDGPSDGTCYIKREAGSDNVYCFGNTESCPEFTEVVEGKTKDDCKEEDMCYQLSDGTYKMGKYSGQEGYTSIGQTCPACYKNSNGKHHWTANPAVDDVLDDSINNESSCKDSFTFDSKIIYIALIVLALIIILLIILKSKKKSKSEY